MDWNEQKEIVVECFSKTFDKEMSYEKACLTEEEILELERDKSFQSRLNLFLIEQRENLMKRLNDLSSSNDEKISLKATIELGKYVYPSKFVDPPKKYEVTDKRTPEQKQEEQKERERVKSEYQFVIDEDSLIVDEEDSD